MIQETQEMVEAQQHEEVKTVLIGDPIGLTDVEDERIPHEAAQQHIEAQGGTFHFGSISEAGGRENLEPGTHFFYMPDLDGPGVARETATQGTYDGLIVAATQVPTEAKFTFAVRMGAGTDNFDKSTGQVVMNAPGQNSTSTARTTATAMLLTATDLDLQQVHNDVIAARDTGGKFSTVSDINKYPTDGLAGKTIAILGATGNIGHEMARVAKAFRMNVVGWSPHMTDDDARNMGITRKESMEAAVSQADVVSLHFPQNNTTIVDDSVIGAMKDGSTLLNFARGPLVDIEALERGLESEKIRRVAVDADAEIIDGVPQEGAPLTPYLKLQEKHPEKMKLMLPHLATDTEHDPTRVSTAVQAVNQMFEAFEGNIYNAVTAVPSTLNDCKEQKPPVGRVDSAEIIGAIAAAPTTLWEKLATATEKILKSVRDETAVIRPDEAFELIAQMNIANNELDSVLGRAFARA